MAPHKGSDPDFDHVFRLIIVGDSGGGKSALLDRYANDTYSSVPLQSTVGVDFVIRRMQVLGRTCKLHIWDTAGQERFHSLVSTYYREADAVLFVASTARANGCTEDADRKLISRIHWWMNQAGRHCTLPESGFEFLPVLVGTKADARCADAAATLMRLADESCMAYFEASAKTGEGAEQLFDTVVTTLVERVLEKRAAEAAIAAASAPVSRVKNLITLTVAAVQPSRTRRRSRLNAESGTPRHHLVGTDDSHSDDTSSSGGSDKTARWGSSWWLKASRTARCGFG
jgi:Ras-related protein Rab-8A